MTQSLFQLYVVQTKYVIYFVLIFEVIKKASLENLVVPTLLSYRKLELALSIKSFLICYQILSLFVHKVSQLASYFRTKN